MAEIWKRYGIPQLQRKRIILPGGLGGIYTTKYTIYMNFLILGVIMWKIISMLLSRGKCTKMHLSKISLLTIFLRFVLKSVFLNTL